MILSGSLAEVEHLRVRGENFRHFCSLGITTGTSPHTRRNGSKFAINPRHNEISPHTRRKQNRRYQAATPSRNISTCVEKTNPASLTHCWRTGHLQIRGENVSLPRTARFLEGTSPRAWRKQRGSSFFSVCSRNISTYAEKTWIASLPGDRRKEHLHVCGEN